METEERNPNALLLENIQTHVKAIAETCGMLVQRLDDTQTHVTAIAETCGVLVRRHDELAIRHDELARRQDEFAQRQDEFAKHQDETSEWLRKLDDGQRRLEDGQRRLEGGQRKLDDGQQRLEDGQHKLEHQHDVLLGRVDKIEIRFELKFNELEAFASDSQRRLQRIETHLQLGGPIRSGHASPRRKAPRDESSKRGKKS